MRGALCPFCSSIYSKPGEADEHQSVWNSQQAEINTFSLATQENMLNTVLVLSLLMQRVRIHGVIVSACRDLVLVRALIK